MIDCPSGLVHADEYLHTLEKCLPHFLSFSSHAQLESYLVEKRDNGKVNEITQTELEYLLVNYFCFHFKQKRGDKSDANWICKEPSCCMRYLECHIQFETLLIHKFLKQSLTDTLGA